MGDYAKGTPRTAATGAKCGAQRFAGRKTTGEAAKKAGVFLWQVAQEFGITDGNFSRLLRKELDAATKAKIYGIIGFLKEQSLKEKAS